jgi:ABC-2 type transport system ATP-binding protein
MIEVKNLTKTFGTCKALDDLTMTIPTGSVYGLVGPNGAGKSTVIRHILGVYRPDSGSITLDGMPIYENPAVKARIGSIPDEVFFFPSATLEDMRRYYRGIYKNFNDTLFEKLFDVFRLPRTGQIRRFSKGMQKQAAFQLTLCTRPDVLVLDEPVDGLDPVMRRQVWSLILSDVAQNGTTVLISSHNLRELEDICDHVGIMDHGKMILQKSLADMQGLTHKVQLVGNIPEGLEVLHETASGRLKTVIVRGTAEEIERKVAAANPAYYDVLPLSLEEIFIYELGGVNDEVKNIIL